MHRRSIVSRISSVALTALAIVGFSTSAFAHVGDHSHMTVSQLANHLLTNVDHELAIMVVGLVIALASASVLLVRRQVRQRSPGKSAT
jgi:hydrogenase/urease accessory protein HupE